MIYIQEAIAPQWRPLVAVATTMTFGIRWFNTALSDGYVIAHYEYSLLFLLGILLSLAGAVLLWSYLVVARRSTISVIATDGDN